MGRVFDAVEMGCVILLLNEADALFGKRSEVKDARDRHADKAPDEEFFVKMAKEQGYEFTVDE